MRVLINIILLFLSTYAAEELVEGNKTASLKEITRDKRQIQTKVERTSPDLSGIQQGCRIEGYETREREICEEITERVCLPVDNVKYKKEIYTRCDTRLKQECNTTLVEVPKEVCEERSHKECFPDFEIVEDTRFTTECESIVQHVCEEHYKVAVPKPVVVPVPIFTPVPPPPPPPHSKRRKRQLTLADPALLSRQVKTASLVPPPPVLSHQELPAPPGCRSVVTQKCHKVPELYAKKVPTEECKLVPGVACHLELEMVETPKCYPVPVEECDDILRRSHSLLLRRNVIMFLNWTAIRLLNRYQLKCVQTLTSNQQL